MKRLIRLTLVAAVVAAIVAVVRALTRDSDPLPSPPTAASAPWPPLSNRDSEAVEAPTASSSVGSEPVAADAVAPSTTAVAASEGPTTPRRPLVAAAWVEPDAEGNCPPGHPIKAKLSSSIFHSPGQMNYDRTAPDRCYSSAEAAEADGLRAAKR